MGIYVKWTRWLAPYEHIYFNTSSNKNIIVMFFGAITLFLSRQYERSFNPIWCSAYYGQEGNLFNTVA